MKRAAIILAAFPLFLWLGGWALADSPKASFLSADQDYRHENFKAAAEKYQAVIKSGRAGGDVYYNLGNAFFRQGLLGRAILNYERARLFIPRDSDLSFNLRYVLDKRRNPPDSEAEAAMNGFLKNFTVREVFFLFAAVNAAFFLALALRQWVRREWTYYLVAALGIAWISAGIFAGAKYWDVRSDDTCVIVDNHTEVRSGPDSNETVLFSLDEGALVYVERQESGFLLIRVNQDKRGWVRSGSAIRVHDVLSD
jgi:tetratricopeptide (TPR) repeat protein